MLWHYQTKSPTADSNKFRLKQSHTIGRALFFLKDLHYLEEKLKANVKIIAQFAWTGSTYTRHGYHRCV